MHLGLLQPLPTAHVPVRASAWLYGDEVPQMVNAPAGLSCRPETVEVLLTLAAASIFCGHIHHGTQFQQAQGLQST